MRLLAIFLSVITTGGSPGSRGYALGSARVPTWAPHPPALRSVPLWVSLKYQCPLSPGSGVAPHPPLFPFCPTSHTSFWRPSLWRPLARTSSCKSRPRVFSARLLPVSRLWRQVLWAQHLGGPHMAAKGTRPPAPPLCSLHLPQTLKPWVSARPGHRLPSVAKARRPQHTPCAPCCGSPRPGLWSASAPALLLWALCPLWPHLGSFWLSPFCQSRSSGQSSSEHLQMCSTDHVIHGPQVRGLHHVPSPASPHAWTLRTMDIKHVGGVRGQAPPSLPHRPP